MSDNDKLISSIMQLRERVASLKEDLKREKLKNISLSDRLEMSFSIDKFNSDQEVERLKKDLNRSLALEFSEYHNDPNAKEFNEDNFIALQAMVFRIEKVLKRFDIL